MNTKFTEKQLKRWKRRRTTTLSDFVVKSIPESHNSVRRNSPTRRADPQPVGLVFQMSLVSDALPVRKQKNHFQKITFFRGDSTLQFKFVLTI